MTYLLDTDVLSNLIKRAPSTGLVARLAGVAPEEQFTSSITLGELMYGAHRSSRTAALLERIEARLLPDLPILPFDIQAARRYGAVTPVTCPKPRGKKPKPPESR